MLSSSDNPQTPLLPTSELESGSPARGEFGFFLDLHSAVPAAFNVLEEPQELQNAPHFNGKKALGQPGIKEQTVLVDLSSGLTSVLSRITKEHSSVLTSCSNFPSTICKSNLLDLSTVEAEIRALSKKHKPQQYDLSQVLQVCGLVAVLRQSARLLLEFGYRVTYLYIKQVQWGSTKICSTKCQLNLHWDSESNCNLCRFDRRAQTSSRH